MSYSSDEKSAAVGELVQGTLSFQQDALGPLDAATEFTEVMEIVYSVLLYDPDVIFYLIYLARNGIKRVILAEDSLCDRLLDAIDDLAMPNRPVNDVSPIASARNSLQAMDAALARSGSIAGEFRRYQQALTRAKGELARTVKMTYVPRGASTPVTDVVRPSAEAKVEVSTIFASTKVKHALLLERVDNIQSALSEFAGGKLGAKVGQRQVLRASQELDSLYEVLEGLTAEERILQARQALLTLLANESVVKALATLPIPGTAKFTQPISTAPLYRLSAHGEGAAPDITGAISAPFPLYDTMAGSPTNLLRFTDLNGSLLLDVDLFPVSSPSFHTGIKPATITGSLAGDFAISTDLATPWPLVSTAETFNITAGVDDLFHITVDGVAYECTLTAGPARTAANIKTDLDTLANWSPVFAPVRPEITVSAAGGVVTISYNVAAPPASYAERSMAVTQGFTYAAALEPWTSGPVGTILATRTAGWDANNEIWVKANADPAHVVVTLPSGTWPGYVVTAAAAASAIDTAGTTNFSSDTVADRVRITSDVDGEGSIITMLADAAGSASFRGLRTLGFIKHQESRETDVAGSALVNVINGNSSFSVQAIAEMVRMDLLSANRATRSAASSLSIPVAANPTTSWPAASEMKVAIAGGDNRGIYQIVNYSWAGGALELVLDRTLRDTTAALMHTITVYREVLKITSLDKGLTGVIEIAHPTGSARDLLGLDGLIHTSTVNELELEYENTVYGWRPLDVSRLHIRVGDLILDGLGVEQAAITSIGQLSDGVLVVAPGVAPSFLLSTAGFSIQSGAFVAYRAFIESLQSWLANTLPPLEEDLKWIDQALGPILLTTPARDRVDTAHARVSSLKSKLADLTTILDTFSITSISAADSALQALLERGFDRARQMLITGQIEEFFAATAGNASFSRAFQTAANEVVVQDINRGSRAKARFDSEFVRVRENWEDDQHPDLDFSDFEEEPPEDAVIDYYLGVDEFEGI